MKIINLASKEYSKAVEKHLKPEDRFVTCIFGDYRMKANDISYRNDIPSEIYNDMREGAGWRRLGDFQAQTGLQNSSYLVSAWDEEKPVGVARVISDMGYIFLIADVIVIPEYQGKGIGRAMMENIIEWLNALKKERPTMMVYLMAAEGKEGFYEKFGFRKRPGEDHMGAGMTMWID